MPAIWSISLHRRWKKVGSGQAHGYERADMERIDDILDSLRQVKTELAALFNVDEVGLFGSVIRGEQQEGSDSTSS